MIWKKPSRTVQFSKDLSVATSVLWLMLMLPTQTATVKNQGHKICITSDPEQKSTNKQLKMFKCRMFSMEGWRLLLYVARQPFTEGKTN